MGSWEWALVALICHAAGSISAASGTAAAAAAVQTMAYLATPKLLQNGEPRFLAIRPGSTSSLAMPPAVLPAVCAARICDILHRPPFSITPFSTFLLATAAAFVPVVLFPFGTRIQQDR